MKLSILDIMHFIFPCFFAFIVEKSFQHSTNPEGWFDLFMLKIALIFFCHFPLNATEFVCSAFCGICLTYTVTVDFIPGVM